MIPRAPHWAPGGNRGLFWPEDGSLSPCCHLLSKLAERRLCSHPSPTRPTGESGRWAQVAHWIHLRGRASCPWGAPSPPGLGHRAPPLTSLQSEGHTAPVSSLLVKVGVGGHLHISYCPTLAGTWHSRLNLSQSEGQAL